MKFRKYGNKNLTVIIPANKKKFLSELFSQLSDNHLFPEKILWFKMQSETKICQNCKKDFIIEPDDFGFYEKIKVPPPTFCPECRFQRRMIFRNGRTLYRRQCDLCQKNIISIYSADASFPVYCQNAGGPINGTLISTPKILISAVLF